MLAILGFGMIITFMALIMWKKLHPVTALILIPLIFALLAGSGLGVGKMMVAGVKTIAPTAMMLLFAIMYFGIMINVGLFDPLATFILRLVKGDPLKILVGTVLLTGVVALDGDGSTTFMIVCTAMLPLYDRLGISRITLAVFALMTNNVLNIVPWGGPTARVVAALGLEANDVFVPLVPGMVISFIFLLVVAYFLGLKERKRLGIVEMDKATMDEIVKKITSEAPELKRPGLFAVNLVMTIILLTVLIMDVISLGVVFAVGTSLALVINYRTIKEQTARIEEHAPAAMNVVIVIIAAGCFMGILAGTKMDAAITNTMVAMIPDSLGPHMALITALLSAPGTFFLSNDAFYYGIVPILAKTGAAYGVTPVEIARASLMGQPIHFLSPLVGALWLLLGITNVSLGEIQKYALPVATGMMLIYIVVGKVLGVI
ncbi:MAG: TRAP transporter large permease subunit [Negativicutes bacterium]|nr:TRAP transporter large permease subunit [Negativicutes bacterium]